MDGKFSRPFVANIYLSVGACITFQWQSWQFIREVDGSGSL